MNNHCNAVGRVPLITEKHSPGDFETEPQVTQVWGLYEGFIFKVKKNHINSLGIVTRSSMNDEGENVLP